MAQSEPRTVTREEFNRELVQALDDLVASARYHGEQIRESFARSEEVSRSADAERARFAASATIARETPPSYGVVGERLDRMEGRLDRIERVLIEIRDQTGTLATKVELEAMNDKIKMVADGYQASSKRLDQVADLLKLRVILP